MISGTGPVIAPESRPYSPVTQAKKSVTENKMSQYLITYLGGNPPSTPEEGKQHFAKYKEWLASLGDAVVSPANPLKNTHTICSDSNVTAGSSIAMSGYTILEAASIEAAIENAKACPFLEIGGSLEVSELMKMEV